MRKLKKYRPTKFKSKDSVYSEKMALYPLRPNRMTVDRDEKGRLYYEYNTSSVGITVGAVYGAFPVDG